MSQATLSASPFVICKEMGDGAVLFCSRSEVYFGLNDVGVVLWNRLAEGTATVDELVDVLHAHYPEQDRVGLEADVREFTVELETNELVLPTGSAATGVGVG